MGFDDRHAETLFLVVVAGLVTPIAFTILGKVGLSGWSLMFSLLACLIGVWLLIVLFLNCVDIYDWYREKASRRQKLGVAVAILGPLTVVGYQAVTWLSGGRWPPLSLLDLSPKWLSEFLQGPLSDHPWYHPHVLGESVVIWLMDAPLSVALCVIGFLLIPWDVEPPPQDQ